MISAPALQRLRYGTTLVINVFEDRRYEWNVIVSTALLPMQPCVCGLPMRGVFVTMLSIGRSRDTDWFSIIDSEWPVLKKRFENYCLLENLMNRTAETFFEGPLAANGHFFLMKELFSVLRPKIKAPTFL